MNRIKIIIPYFGKLPDTFPFWYNSALDNQDVDYLFITDCDVKEAPNFKVEKTTLEKETARYEKALGMKLSIQTAYKLCDFRTAYGVIYADELEGYDFWGFGDVDLVYGRIRHFLTEEILERYDMINCWGHLCLYRNYEFTNKVFMERHEGYLDYEDVFSDPEHRFFEELWSKGTPAVMCDFHSDRALRCEPFFDDVAIPDLFKHFKSYYSRERKCMTFIHKDRTLYRVYFDSRFRRHEEQTMYAHFQKRKGWTIDVDDYSDYIIYPNVFRRPFRFLQNLRLAWYGTPRIIDYLAQKLGK